MTFKPLPRQLRATLALALAAATAPMAAASDIDWRLSGFATLGAVHTRSDTLQFARVGIDAPGEARPTSDRTRCSGCSWTCA